MKQVQAGDTVKISYIGKLDNGQVFANATADEPMTVTIGNHELPPTLEAALVGMSIGEEKKVKLEPDEGYGPRLKDLTQVLDRSVFGDKFEPKVGLLLTLKANHENSEVPVPATVVEVKGDQITVDYNHPLAGHNLTYTVRVEEIVTSN